MLLGALSAGLNLLTWTQDSFGLADSYDEAAGRYRGLRGGTLLNLTDPQGAGTGGAARGGQPATGGGAGGGRGAATGRCEGKRRG